jgi:superfamily I DNA and/or RNA helicase
MFEHLYSEGGVYEGVGIQLKTQYRMHRDIMYFPNKRMYGGSLRCGRDVETLSGFDAIAGYNVGGQVHETENSSRYNKAEIEVLLAVISNLLGGQEGRDNRSVSLEASDIAVITPYEAQKNMIKELSEERMSLPSRGMSVDTVDSFQGSEREVVLISLVRSNAEGEIGFLGRPEDGPRRLNVAMTRAKRFCGIVGDWHTLSKNKEGKCSGLYQNLRSYLKDTGRMSEPDPALL